MLPRPGDAKLAFFVREAFPSIATGTDITQGVLAQTDRLDVTSEMNDGGIIFGDGMEMDNLSFDWGVTAEISVSEQRLHLVEA